MKDLGLVPALPPPGYRPLDKPSEHQASVSSSVKWGWGGDLIPKPDQEAAVKPKNHNHVLKRRYAKYNNVSITALQHLLRRGTELVHGSIHRTKGQDQTDIGV